MDQDRSAPAKSDRGMLTKSDRTDRETFYYVTMSADLSQIKRRGPEITEDQFRKVCSKDGVPEDAITRLLENARSKK